MIAKQNILPKLLVEIVEFLKTQSLHLSQQSRDGRKILLLTKMRFLIFWILILR